ncbi:MAG: 50S ribosomal protein L28 [Elusimicrobia bacterium RIFOXYD2_FULL_34_15]|nr:MAG: 50S ribosomal protein L28 [Elusimicrobia bacterium RIFOXYD2_FULL_34_15]
MAFKCIICDKRSVSGNNVSHSHKASKRRFKPNLQKIKILLGGIKQSAYVCTKCIKSGRIVKAA